MRIISGKAKGTNLYTLKGDQTRPTSDRAKEALFNIIGNDILDTNFLDLFAGSGAIGLEAASRGAKKVILSDCSKEAIDIIRKNAKKIHFEQEVMIYKLNYEETLKTKVREKQDYIFLDPPYQSNYLYKAIQIIIDNDLLQDEGTIIAETDRVDEIEKQLENLNINVVDIRKYGRNHFLFLKKLSE